MPEPELNVMQPALRFGSPVACAEAGKERSYAENCAFVILHEGPRGGLGMCEMLPEPAALYGQDMGSDAAPSIAGRFSGAKRGFCFGHAGPEAAAGGPIPLVDLQIGDAEFAKRKKDWQPRKTNSGSGALWKYAQMVAPAIPAAVAHPGTSSEIHVYADV